MIVFIFTIAILIIGIIIAHFSEGWDWKEPLGFTLIAIGGFCLFIALIALPINIMTVYSDIAEYKSVELTIEQTRNNDNQLENIALQHKIIDSNKWLASQLYYNSTLFDLWIPDEILELKPLQ